MAYQEIAIRFIQADGSPLQPEPGPIWLESYEYGERMYVPGWVTHDGYYNGMPHITMHRLEGPGVISLDQLQFDD